MKIKKGSLVFDILMAIATLSIILLSLFNVAAGSLKLSSIYIAKSAAYECAENIMERTLSKDVQYIKSEPLQLITKNSFDGDFLYKVSNNTYSPFKDEQFLYKIDVINYKKDVKGVKVSDLSLKRIDVTVYYGKRGSDMTVTLTSYKALRKITK